MISSSLRVAFFPDSYNEIDGVANTARHFEAFAQRNDLPFLTVFGWTENGSENVGSVRRLSRRRGRFGFALDKKHDFDLIFWRHLEKIEAAVREFDPDILHITGPSDIGQIGLAIAQRLKIPLAASWHTNVHQYAERRGSSMLSFLPESTREKLGGLMGRGTLMATLRFYKAAQILFAPNQELIELMEKGTGKPCYPMYRGVDTELFNPKRRTREGGPFTIGFVGRLTVEKNIHYLADVERALIGSGFKDFQLLIVGQGAEEPWLRANLRQADFTGVLRGEALAEAYANMDVFLFPSLTDTYGNVVLEALSCGVPAVVSDGGGPRFIVREGETGFVARDLPEYVARLRRLAENPEELRAMRVAARAHAMTASWDAVFESVYAAYERTLKTAMVEGKKIRMRPHTVLL